MAGSLPYRNYQSAIMTDAAAMFAITRPDRRLLWLYLLRCAFGGPAFPIVFLPCFFKYETLRYRFDDEGISMSWGILWRQEIYLTYARIQDIHLSRGLFERWLGLATIHIQTAAGSAAAEMSIVGLLQYEAVRDFLYSKMRGARFGDKEAPTSGPQDETVALLTEIRDEMRAMRQQAETRKP
ncbi:MAG: PH domain-containing protein [Planctomycetes bacterium]|nr:PH domain-containing protein [Planctomycetota bacterium]